MKVMMWELVHEVPTQLLSKEPGQPTDPARCSGYRLVSLFPYLPCPEFANQEIVQGEAIVSFGSNT